MSFKRANGVDYGQPLTKGEQAVLEYLFKGKDPKEIAAITGYSTITIYHYVQQCKIKLGADTIGGLIYAALQQGLLQAPPLILTP